MNLGTFDFLANSRIFSVALTLCSKLYIGFFVLSITFPAAAKCTMQSKSSLKSSNFNKS